MAGQALQARFDEAAIDRIFASVDQCHLPGAAVGIALGGRPVYRRGFGLANIELPALLTPSMRMRIGSTSKHFAALAYMLLCEEGRAGLDDPIGQHVPGLHSATAGATMRQLMGHTSGIRDLLSISLMTNGVGRPISERDLLRYYATIDDVDFAPGDRWSHNNGGYSLLGAAIEAIAGEPLADVLAKRIFEPAGMHDTLLRGWDSDFVPNSATLHFRDASGGWSRTGMGIELGAAGGVVSTTDDMLRWLKQLAAPTVGSPETWRLMREPHRLTTGASTGYGLGLISGSYRGARIMHHGGTVIGGNSQMITLPDAGLDIAIAANRGDVSAALLAQQVIDAMIEGLDPPAEPVASDTREGAFRSPATGRVVQLSVAEDKQLMAVDGSGAVPMVPDGKGGFALPPAMDFLRQTLRLSGDGVTFSDFGREDMLIPLTDGEAASGQHAGHYVCAAVDATAIVAAGEDGQTVALTGRHGRAEYKALPLSADIWRVEQIGMPMLSGLFSFGGAGFTFTTNRMQRLRFTRAQ